MGALSFLDRIKSVFTGDTQKTPKEFKDLHKYERLLEEERKAKEEHIEYNLTPEANRALRFAKAYGECYDQCAGLAIRQELKAASLDSLIPKDVVPVTSKDALTLKKNPGEAAVTELVGEILGEDMSEGPRPTAEHLVKQQINDDIRRSVGSNMKVIIVYATETGCAEALAYSTYIRLHQRGVDVKVRSASMVTVRQLVTCDRCIFIVSTAAYGEFPHTIQPLIDEFQKQKLGPDFNYTVFGLGDSRYPLFNYAARKLVALLDSAGAICFYGVGYGDEQHPLGHLGEFITWISKLCDLWGSDDVNPYASMDFNLKVDRLGTESKEVPICVGTYIGTVISNDIITGEGHFRPVRNLLIDCNGQHYDVGDVCRIYPTGDPTAVERALRSLGYDPQEAVIINKVDNNGYEFNRDLELIVAGNASGKIGHQRRLPFEGTPIKLRTLFADFLSLDNVCTQWQMYIMSSFASLDIHKEKLVEMSSFTIEACAEYNRYCKDEHRSLLEVLHDFNSVKLPLDVLINITTPYYPRMYSIASTPTTIGISRLWEPLSCGITNGPSYRSFKRCLMHKRSDTGIMELCVAAVCHNTPYGRTLQGQVSDLLNKLDVGSLIRFDIAKSELAMTILDVKTPVAFICTGTGLAACKPLLEARIEIMVQMWNKQFVRPKVRDLALFGFRRKRQDHIYLGNFNILNMWCDVHFVYSRESGRKVYVQDALVKHSKRVVDIMMNGIVVIAGRSHPMPKQVMQRLRDLLVEHAGFGTRAADKFIESSLLGGKIILDTWG
ncbi:flavodoxin domain containing protein [Babesia ovis]|uniref:Flavodoxin domain containing protein n=1 Tax=Babesia ovis TaxID=5869 RepID=A0A9W5TA78_BABOV|nr:flavodoxin domain containing protein [Babesia ovis]